MPPDGGSRSKARKYSRRIHCAERVRMSGFFQWYAGDGRRISERNLELPPFDAYGQVDNPEHDVADRALRDADPFLPPHLRDAGPVRSVGLVDEIDKAPRDLPNDVLNELERMSFAVTETRRSFTADPRYRPILILTSNSEKNLPDAFLRRC